MSKKDVFGDEIQDDAKKEMDFASMLNQSFKGGVGSRKVGEVFTGEILSIGREEAFVATGTPTDGALPTLQLLDKEKKMNFKVGDKIEVRIVRMREGEILLQKADSKTSSAGMDSLEDAYDMELPMEGKVLEVVKGGYRVSIGHAKAFCPVSQMDLRAGADPASHVGKNYEFMITQFDEKARNIVVSRRKLLEVQKAEEEGEFLTKAKPGEIFTGTIRRIEKFGAFVQLENGLEGLIPISEIAWGRVASPSDVVGLGQTVSVLLLKIEELDGRLRMSFSLKQAGGEGDPWSRVIQQFPVGTIVNGTVEKKEAFGLFIQLAPGISGLMPKSKWRDHVDGQSFENKKRGDVFPVRVDQIQFEEKRLTLAPPGDGEDNEWRSVAQGAPAAGLGTMADLFKGLAVKDSKKK